MSNERRIHAGRRAFDLIALALAAIVLFTGKPAAAAVQPDDPGAYCRIAANVPTASGYSADGVGYYSVTFTAHAYITCNGQAYTSTLNAQLNWTLIEDGVATTSGIAQGSSHTCTGSCDAYAYYTHVRLHCGEYYEYRNTTTGRGSYKRYSTSTSVTLGPVTSATGTGSSHMPPGAC